MEAFFPLGFRTVPVPHPQQSSTDQLSTTITKVKVILRPTVSLSWCQQPIWHPPPIFISIFLMIFRHLRICWCGVPSLTRRRVCNLQLLLGLVSAVFLGSEPRRTHDHIFTLKFETTELEGQVPVFISPRYSVTQLYSRNTVIYSTPWNPLNVSVF
jgi:hypothetical protein